MSPQERAFREEIAADPDDDTTRLVYADWLEDDGRPERAEFIRVQIRKNEPLLDDKTRRDLAVREGTLLLQHETTWRRELPELNGVTWGVFTRGFVSSAFAESVDAFAENAEALFAAAPVRSLRVGELSVTCPGRLSRMAELGRLTELDLGNTNLGFMGAQSVARSPHACNLTSLLLHYNNLGDPAAQEIARSPSLANLRELYLSGNRLTQESARELASSPWLERLEELDLRDNDLCTNAAAALAQGDLRSLRTLYLVNNRIGWSGAASLAYSARLPRLERLYLNHNPVGNDGASAFAATRDRAALIDLDLRHADVRDAGGRALADAAGLTGLHTLWLGGNRMRLETLGLLRRKYGDRLKL